jgi:hypothetical protein
MKATINATRVIRRCIMCLALSLMAMAALPLRSQAAQVDKQVPFRAAFTTEFESDVISEMPPIALITVNGEGKGKGRIWARPQQVLLTSLSISTTERRLRPTRLPRPMGTLLYWRRRFSPLLIQ